MKTKAILLYLCGILNLIALNSCTRNNGDIGPWFGTWHVETIEIDGQPDASYQGEYFVQFQTNVVSIIQRSEYNDAAQSFGEWEASGNTLTIDFPLPKALWCNLPGMTAHNRLTIEQLTTAGITLSMMAATGQVYRYRLKKWA